MKLYVRGYRSLGMGSRFIKWFTFGTIGHVSLVFHMGYRTDEIEALQRKGVIRHDPRPADEYDFIEYSVPVGEMHIVDAHIRALETVGDKYDMKGIWGFIVRRDKHNPARWFCSEHVAYILYKVGYKLSRRAPYQETPASVCESLRLISPTPEVGGA